ncbi:MAG: hypothetical protein ACOCWR_04300 [Oceanidesulfovibrio sp.]
MARTIPDPRVPRKNRELPFIEKLMAQNWREFRKAEDFTMKRGYAAILNAHLEAWLDEPEFIIDLKEGPASAKKSQREDAPEHAVSPFDGAVVGPDRFFYAGGSGILTELMDRDRARQDPHRPYRMSGYVITLYEKLYATGNETDYHFTSDVAFHRFVKPATPTRRAQVGDIHVLMDPKGFHGRTACKIAYRTQQHTRAQTKADALAERFGIRFLVARVADIIDTH